MSTLIDQGYFTADGTAETIILRSDFDYFKVINQTVLDATGAGTGAVFEWYRGMTQDTGIIQTKLAADDSLTIDMMTSGGFTYINSSTDSELGTINSTVTAISNAAIPIVSATSTAGLTAGDVVRFINVTGAQQFGGIDFEIDTIVASTSFRLPYAPQIVAGTTGSFYPVITPRQFYPRSRYVSKITAANPAVITTTVSHGYTVGQTVRLVVPDVYGMTQMDGLQGKITAVTASTITTDIDATGFTAFAWPLTGPNAFTPAQVIPVGNQATTSEGAVVDQAYIGMKLAAGTTSPAGAASDLIRWQAFRSISR